MGVRDWLLADMATRPTPAWVFATHLIVVIINDVEFACAAHAQMGLQMGGKGSRLEGTKGVDFRFRRYIVSTVSFKCSILFNSQ